MTRKDAILLVEDSEDDVFLFRRALERSRCEADLCHHRTVAAATQYLESLTAEKRPLPRMAFVDLILPKVGGAELVTWIKRSDAYQRIPVIVITGVVAPTAASQLARFGATAVMVKPSNIEHLVDAIHAACTFWLKYSICP
jgi:CheY-like chemotaxis protein